MRPAATYRLQITPGFDLHAAADVCDYLADLGADAVYTSPILPSATGSDHGYDVIGFDTVDPQRGGLDGWTRLLAAARARHLKTVVDIVPNHTGVEDAAENAAWWDVLKHGREGEHGSWFDIEWARGRILLPVLGDDFDDSQLEVVGSGDDAELHYFEHRFPVAPGTGDGTAAEVHGRQHYELVNWRRADTDQNYRRFFAVTTLAGLRVEDRAVFEATHTQITRWLHDDHIDGLRVDHPDGLADPVGYMRWLRELAGPDAWLLVEKILEHGEELPRDWPVDGTTGYDALTEVTGVLLDTSAEGALTELYRELTGDPLTSAEHVAKGKRNAVSTILQAEVSRLARLVPELTDAPAALVELLVAFPVYRSYLPAGADDLAAALTAGRAARPDLSTTFDALEPRLYDPADELCVRFQQLSGAVMAKGVEDTAFYRYTRFVALNEVGNDPGHFGVTLDDFHAAQELRQATVPNAMTTLSTHDTKRGEDVRARLAVLSEIPDDWATLVTALMRSAPLPDAPFAYLLWQTFAGVGFIERDRMHAYLEKAMREAATSTTWTSPDEAFEQAVHGVADAAYDQADVHGPLSALIERIAPYGWTNSLSQKLVQLTMPGIPDVYQGTELWEDSLVDPDNRRAVDYDARRRLLVSMGDEPPAVAADGAAKLWVTSRTLRLRREHPELFDTYTPLRASGPAAEHVIAYDRGGVITVATRLPLTLAANGGWRDTTLELGAAGTDLLTGRGVAAQVTVGELLDTLPVALIVR